jgi:hypothetical protein
MNWFTLKKYGYGWTPNTWQGWVVILAYLCSLYAIVNWLNKQLLVQAVLLVVITVCLILICVKKGGKPRWNWG